MGESQIITSILGVLCGGGAIALLWKPLAAGLTSLATSNRATGEIISNYKEQVVSLTETNKTLVERNNDLQEKHDKNVRRISSLETDLRLIKSALGILLAMSEANGAVGNERFRSEVNRLIATLEDDSNENAQ